MTTPIDVASAVFNVWLTTGKPVTRDAIAEYLGVTSQALRKFIDGHYIEGCAYDSISKEGRSSSYGYGTGRLYEVKAWVPAREYLRQKLLASAGP